MRKKSFRVLMGGLVTLSAVLLVSCEKPRLGEEIQAEKVTTAGSDLKAATANLPGRNLAANCFQCHGTNGYAGELKIANMSSSEIVSKMSYFKSRDPKTNIMNVHARAYTDAEIKLIADYFSQQ